MKIRVIATALPAILLFSCAVSDSTNRQDFSGTTRRFLALGDSYTIGESVGADQRWPVQLARALRASGIAIDEPQIVATTGWTTDELNAAIDAADPHGPFDLVTLLIGVNDQYRGGTPEVYRPKFGAMLRRAIGFAGGDPSRVIVVSIPDWGVTPFAASRDRAAVAAAIDAFNTANREEAAIAGVAWIDVTGISRRAPSQPSLIASDGLHPSGEMYSEWVKAILPAARTALKR